MSRWTRASVRPGSLAPPGRRLGPPISRWLAIGLIGASGGLIAACVWLRGDAAGADTYAYWLGTRTWLDGGNPYRPVDYAWPYAYAPWLLPAFVPWAILPWPVAEMTWRGAMLLGLAWSVAWAYRRRPLATGIAFTLLAIPIGLTLDGGNIGLFCALAIWAAQRTGSRAAGLLWAAATAVKWYPAPFLLVLAPRARRIGLVAVAAALVLYVATWPWTLEQLRVVFTLGVPRATLTTSRVDHLAILWGAIPWLWLHGLPSIERRLRTWPRRMAHRTDRSRGAGTRPRPALG